MRQVQHPEYQYLDLLKEVLESGVKNVDRGTGAVSYGVFGRQCRYDLLKGFPLLTTKRVYWKGVLHELNWFLKGMTNIKYLVDNDVHIWDDYPYKYYLLNSKLKAQNLKRNSKSETKGAKLSKKEFIERIANDDEFAKEWGELPRIYGEMWRAWPTKTGRTIDQLKWVIDELKADPDARNAIVNSWNPEYLYSMARYKEASLFPICHNMYQVSIKGGKLSLQLYQRSADLFLGVPFNIASYALLTLVLGQILGVGPGELVHTFGDAHIYADHIEQVKEQLSREPKKLPTVRFRKKLKGLKDFRPEDVELVGYEPHGLIRAKLSVSGGYFDERQKQIIREIHEQGNG